MAVLPELQKQGIGTQLVKRGLEELRLGRVAFVMTLGYPAYYLLFGFAPTSCYGIRCQWQGQRRRPLWCCYWNGGLAEG